MYHLIHGIYYVEEAEDGWLKKLMPRQNGKITFVVTKSGCDEEEIKLSTLQDKNVRKSGLIPATNSSLLVWDQQLIRDIIDIFRGRYRGI